MAKFLGYPLTETWFPQGIFSELTVYHFGRHHCPPNYSVGPMMTWDHYLFHYIISGKGMLYSTDSSGSVREYSVSSGQGFMIWPGQLCTYASEEEEPWEYAWIEFDGALARELIDKTSLQYDHPIYMSQDNEKKSLMVKEMLWIINNAHSPSMELIGHFYIFLSSLIQSSSQHDPITSVNQKETHLQKAADYIRQHYYRNLTVQEIADHCGVHRSYLFQIFTESLGLSPLQFLIRHRIRKAGELLRTTNYSIGEVSVRVGYPNQMNFVRAFKRLMGITPLKWKKGENGFSHSKNKYS